MKTREAVEKFLIAIQADGVKDATVTWYRVRFRRFLEWYGDREVDNLTIDDVRLYIVKVREEIVSPHTFFSWVRVVRRLFKWLYDERRIDDNFYWRIKLPKLPQPMPKAVEISDVVKLLEACQGTPGEARDRAVILFLLDTGCRVGGLCGLKIEDLDLGVLRASLHEKGEKDRIVLFGDRTAEVVSSWLRSRPFPESEWVFTSLVEDRPMNPNSAIQMLRRLKKRSGVLGRVNPHAFRHASAREYIMNGGDLASASQLMGHTQIAVTKMFYAVFHAEELREKHQAFSPVGRLPLNGREG